MRRNVLLSIFILMASVLVLAACSGSAANGSSGAAEAVQDYLQAVVSGDEATLSKVSCPDWQESAMLEMDSFIGVTAELDNALCTQTGGEGGTAEVECSGQILATYNNEQQEFDLAGRVYTVNQQGGEWLVCGAQ